MGSVINRTNTADYQVSVNTPDFTDPPYLINPVVTGLTGPSKYWKLTGDTLSMMSAAEIAAVDNAAADAAATAAGPGNQTLYGDGKDGDLQFSIGGGAVQTLTQDVYPDKFIVDAGVTVKTDGFRVIARKAIKIFGTLSCVGGNASGATAGTNATNGPLGQGAAGATGTNAAGAAGSGWNNNNTPGIGGDGGAGGAGATAAGAGGNTRGPSNQRVRPRRTESLLAGVDDDRSASGGAAFFQGGAGGGAGGGNGGTNLGGGGGAGGGHMVLCSPKIFMAPGSIISVAGGNGGNAVSGNSGGGGGGGGGLLSFITQTLTENGTVVLSGGTGGTGTGTGAAGTAGSNGKRIDIFDK
jgi:hypothetical protein